MVFLVWSLFIILESVNSFHALIMIGFFNELWIGQAKNALVGTFLFLDQIVWAGRTGIYKVWFNLFDKKYSVLSWTCVMISSMTAYQCCFEEQDTERLNRISRISLFCWLAGTCCTTLVEVSCLSKRSSIIQVEIILSFHLSFRLC